VIEAKANESPRARERRTRPRRREWFTDVGREQLIALLELDLAADSYLLDIGCGMLRGGRWVIPLLKPGHYCGLEVVPERVQQGLRNNLEEAMITLKQPRFDHNANFDFSPFGVQFTHFVARSIWSHASKKQIEAMLDGMVAHGAPHAVLLASFRAAGPDAANDYTGDEWRGKSHESDEPGIVAHSVKWLREACEQRNLDFEVSQRAPVKKNGQVWAVVRKEEAGGESSSRRRVSRLARQIKHNLRTLKFATSQLVEELDLDA